MSSSYNGIMSTTPTARALSCSDILQEIFFRLQERDEEGRRPLASLARAAVVCRAMSFHALDALWVDIDSLKPVLQLLHIPNQPPACQCSDLTVPQSTECMERKNAVDALSRSKFPQYARRVRELLSIQCGEMDQSVCSALMHALSSFQPIDAVILPNLRHLRLGNYCQAVPDSGLKLVLAPSIRHLELLNDTGLLNDSMVIALGKSPILQSLHVTGRPFDTLSFPHVSRWSNLRVFASRQSYLDLETLDALSEMESLHELHLIVHHTQPCRTKGDGFPNLRSLSIEGHPAGIAETFASFQHSSHLHTLHLTTVNWHSEEAYQSLVKVLSEIQHIEHFSLTGEGKGAPRSLFGLPCLWRGLRTCRLSIDDPWHSSEPSFPLELLLEIARQCPRIEVLSLPPIDFDPILPPDEPPETVVLSQSLRELNIRNMDEGEIWEWEEALPMFIERSFPALDLQRMARSADNRVQKSSYPYNARWLRWATVVERVRALRDTQTAQR
ncbi:uncharacterized protein C8Q71DRAFT_419778 [Rhodofomes roseus]|uniref:F-box domain-containing protein n=1 Tax=Rhodofomes roseus TaxID=34475 RepID=A0ABQ8KPY8_9APHY|nr:uncharacterized protein C8Q71DRAFT_419778 [Rhodofomes roseus]KAH9840683.1 hypothetical protein C8Q71DRAFT_419778 [Rhodofomes roseus]